MDTHIPDFFEALTTRDSGADGLFFYAVATTGIYCRPSCPAKAPRPENTRYYASAQAAEAAGYRPCKRCRPNQPDQTASLIEAACRAIEAADTPPDLASLAAGAGLSPSHFHRLFKAKTGVTPKAYAAANRAARVKTALRESRSVTEAVYDSGHNAPSRFYETAAATLGMTPQNFRAGAADQTIEFAVAPCALGLVLAARTPAGICAVALGDDAQSLQAELAATFPKATITPAGADFAATLAHITAAIAHPGGAGGLPLDIIGTAFQRRVWQALLAIPAGRTATYSELAAAIGAPTSTRAVAAACAANKLAVLIPCHRVLRADGDLAGYRWGLRRKQALLDRERNAP